MRAMVVRADSEEDARSMAQEQGGEEVARRRKPRVQEETPAWTDARYSTCEELLPEGKPGWIVADFGDPFE